jgi:hypothetical protein
MASRRTKYATAGVGLAVAAAGGVWLAPKAINAFQDGLHPVANVTSNPGPEHSSSANPDVQKEVGRCVTQGTFAVIENSTDLTRACRVAAAIQKQLIETNSAPLWTAGKVTLLSSTDCIPYPIVMDETGVDEPATYIAKAQPQTGNVPLVTVGLPDEPLPNDMTPTVTRLTPRGDEHFTGNILDETTNILYTRVVAKQLSEKECAAATTGPGLAPSPSES